MRSIRNAAFVGAIALVLVSCSNAEGDGVATLDDGAAAAGDSSPSPAAEQEEALQAFAECMRDNGVEDFPDPQVGSDGRIEIGVGSGDGPLSDEDAEAIDAAMEACRDLLPQGEGPAGISEEDQAALQDALVEYAQCMREHGIDMPDPDFSGDGGVLQQIGDGVDPDSSEFQEADEACRPALEDALPDGGGPGFVGGVTDGDG